MFAVYLTVGAVSSRTHFKIGEDNLLTQKRTRRESSNLPTPDQKSTGMHKASTVMSYRLSMLGYARSTRLVVIIGGREQQGEILEGCKFERGDFRQIDASLVSC